MTASIRFLLLCTTSLTPYFYLFVAISYFDLEQITLVENNFEGVVPDEICDLRDGYLEALEVDCASDVVCPETCCTLCM